LINLLGKLNKFEVTSFKKYLQSPYFNTNQTIVGLFDFVVKHNNEQPAQLKQIAHDYIFPNKVYNDVRIRQQLSLLQKHLEHFLEVEELRQSKDKTHLFNALLKKEEAKSIRYVLLEQGHETQYFDLQKEWQLHQINDDFKTQQAQKTQRLMLLPNYDESLLKLEKYYVLAKLKLLCEKLNINQIKGLAISEKDSETLLSEIATNNYYSSEIIKIYAINAQCFLHPNNENLIDKFLAMLNENIQSIEPKEARELFIYAQNYCIRKINGGQEDEYLPKVLGIYKSLLQSKVILDNNKLSPWDFKNIVVTGLRLGEMNWVKKFMDENASYLDGSVRQNAVNYNMAKWHFYNENWNNVIELLLNVEYEDVFYALDSKAMLLKTYFELDEDEALFNSADSFKIYLLRNKKISKHHKQSYQNFLRFIKKLLKLNVKDKEALEKFRTQFDATKVMADKNWFLDKIDELGI